MAKQVHNLIPGDPPGITVTKHESKSASKRVVDGVVGEKDRTSNGHASDHTDDTRIVSFPPITFKIKPYRCPPAKDIPPRPWVYRKHYLRLAVSATIAAPGRCKTTYKIIDAFSGAVGKNLITGEPVERFKTLHLNAEEPQSELDLRVAAVRQRYGIEDHQYEGWFFPQSVKAEIAQLKMATKTRSGQILINQPLVRHFI